MPRFSPRDTMFLAVLAAIVVAWGMDRTWLASDNRHLRNALKIAGQEVHQYINEAKAEDEARTQRILDMQQQLDSWRIAAKNPAKDWSEISDRISHPYFPSSAPS